MSDWQNGLCGCFNDCSTCIITYFCPCYMFGKAAESVGDSCCLCGLVYFIGPVNLYARTHIRGKIREKKGINGSCIGDCCIIYFCWPCTLCQEAQEIKDIAPQAMLRE